VCLVTIIMPVHNGEKFIAQSIESVIVQSYKDWELVIVDDASSDKSYEISLGYASIDSRIQVIKSEINLKVARARNLALSKAKGRFIAFLDSDDVWLPTKLDKQIKYMLANNVVLSYAAYYKMDESGKIFDVVGVPLETNYKTLLKTCVIGCLTAVYDTKFIGLLEMSEMTKREDFALWLDILRSGEYVACGIQEPLGKYRVYSGQSSGRKASMALENWKLYRKIEGLGFFVATYYFINYLVRGVMRTKFPALARFIGILD